MMKVFKRFANCSLENYEITTPEQKRLVEELHEVVERGMNGNILIIGSVGTGKTHLAYSLMNAIASRWTASTSGEEYYRGDKIYYTTIKEIIDNIKASWNNGGMSDMDTYCKVPLLIIDEIGVQYGTDSERTELYEVFNRRYNDMLPIIAISNHDQKSLLRILGQRIFDRLTGGASIYELSGKSFRQGAENGRS